MDRVKAKRTSVGSQLTVLWTEVLSRPAPITLSEQWTEHLKIRNLLETLNLSNTTNRWRVATEGGTSELPS